MSLRFPLVTVPLAAALAFAGAADASSHERCSTEAPCPWFIHVDASGFVFSGDEDGWDWTRGDVFEVSVLNEDARDHVLTLEGYDITIVARGAEHADGPLTEHVTIVLDRTGTFLLRDDVTNAAVTVRVADAPSGSSDDGTGADADGDGSDTDGRGTPGAAPLAVLAVLALGARGLRRG